MGRIIAIANQKGGVGKTTTSINLSACIAAKGKRVLVIDMDPQGNTTSGYGIEKNELDNTIYELILGDCSIVEISLIENIQREDLNPIEEAQAYKRLLDEFKLKQDEVAERVSKSRTAVTNSMRLLKLCDGVQQMIIDDMLSTGHARALIPIEDQEMQLQLAQRIFDEKLSVREVEKLVKGILKPDKETQKKEEKPQTIQYIYQDLENKLKEKFSRKVEIISKGKSGSGKIEIEFYSNDDLDQLIESLSKIERVE